MVKRTTDVPPSPGLCPPHVPTLSLRAVAAGRLARLDEVFVPSGRRSGSHAGTKAPTGPGAQDAAAWLLHPPGFTHRFAAILRRTGVKQIWKEIIIFALFLTAVYCTAAQMWV